MTENTRVLSMSGRIVAMGCVWISTNCEEYSVRGQKKRREKVVGLQVSPENSQMHDCGEFGISFFDPDCCPTLQASGLSARREGRLFLRDMFFSFSPSPSFPPVALFLLYTQHTRHVSLGRSAPPRPSILHLRAHPARLPCRSSRQGMIPRPL